MTDETRAPLPPPGYVPLGPGEQCKCRNWWRSPSGLVWCCKASPTANPAGMRPSNMGVYNKHGIVDQHGVVTLSVALLNDMLDAAREEGRQGAGPIPPGVYYLGATDNFYSMSTKLGMGNDFYARWRPRRAEFPTGMMP